MTWLLILGIALVLTGFCILTDVTISAVILLWRRLTR